MPESARLFWAYVDEISDDEDLGAASFLEQAHRRHFYFGIADGVKAERELGWSAGYRVGPTSPDQS